MMNKQRQEVIGHVEGTRYSKYRRVDTTGMQVPKL